MMLSLENNFLTLSKLVQLGLLVLALAALSACTLLPFSKVKEDKVSIAEEVDLYEFEINQNDISLLREELDSFRPSVNRLIELESELRELIDVVNASGAQEFTLPLQNQNLSDFASEPQQTSLENELEFIQNMPLTSTSATMDDKFTNVQVKPAPAISNELYADSKPLPNYQQSTKQLKTSQIQTQNITDKFSSQLPIKPNDCASIARGTGYALHIASYKVKSSAEKNLNKVLSEMNKVANCKKSAMIAEVTVKNQDFYSARIGSYQTKEQAKMACAEIKSFTTYCAVTQNIGTAI